MSIQNHKRLLFLFRFFIYAAILFYIGTYKYNVVIVDGDSMKSTYLDKDVSLIDYSYYKFNRPEVGDVICAEVPEETRQATKTINVIKRIVAEEGAYVQIRNGSIFVNNKINTDYSIKKSPLTLQPTKLHKDQYFIIGDNREESTFYIISKSQIIGKVLL